MRRLRIIFLIALVAPATTFAGDRDDLAQLLDEFLWGASIGSVDVHERFWSDELVYTSSTGSRTDKASIVGGMRASADNRPDEPEVVYTAEEVDIRVYDDMAIVAFRLVGTEQESGDRAEYFNTGTFVKRDGEWRAVAWQATRIPKPD